MVDSLMLRGEVIDVNGYDYLVRMADGSVRSIYSDSNTFGNGPAS